MWHKLRQTQHNFNKIQDSQSCILSETLTDGETGPLGRYGSGNIRNGYPEYGGLYIPPSWCFGTAGERQKDITFNDSELNLNKPMNWPLYTATERHASDGFWFSE